MNISFFGLRLFFTRVQSIFSVNEPLKIVAVVGEGKREGGRKGIEWQIKPIDFFSFYLYACKLKPFFLFMLSVTSNFSLPGYKIIALAVC